MFNTKNLTSRRLASPRALCVLALAVSAPAVTAASAQAAKPVADQYIVTLAKGHDPHRVAGAVGAKPRHVYASALNGFAAKLDDHQLAALRRNPNVAAIEQDQLVSADATTQSMDADGQPWGLDRIDQTGLPLSSTYSYNGTGAGVRAYVLDTGIQTSNPEFEGRAKHAYDATGTTPDDCNSHGTHVAGTIGSKTFGVAKKVWLRSVKVLGAVNNCSGAGYTSDIIDGIDWVRDNFLAPAVVNMSLGGAGSAAMDSALADLVMAGVFVSVSAGNNTTDACATVSPARSPFVYTVAGTDSGDQLYAKTNWGSCVDIFAPAVGVKSVVPFGSPFKTGTSMASPHVAGTAALLCQVSAAQCQPYAVMSWLQNNAVQGVVKGLTYPFTVNRLLNKRDL